jgi:uncharacterized DUF497 family protein
MGPRESEINLEIHDISFDEASTAFGDILSLVIYDPLHFDNEDRFVLIGSSHRNRILVIVYTERGNKIRIISARKATRKEKEQYEENAKRSKHA